MVGVGMWRQDIWATLPRTLPLVSFFDDYAPTVPTWSSLFFLFTFVHILASLQDQGKCHHPHKVFLDSTLSLE